MCQRGGLDLQPLAWYVRRLTAMSFAEVIWRLRNKLLDVADLLSPPRHRVPSLGRILVDGSASLAAAVSAGRVRSPAEDGRVVVAERGLLDRANSICHHCITLFDLENHDLGRRIRWNYEYKARLKTPMIASCRIDYRDHTTAGDCKFVWEPNRHQHLVVLARAYRVTGERRYAAKVIEHIEDWIEQCPVGVGMNWRSPLELAIRLINWSHAYDVIADAGVVTCEHLSRVLPVVDRHLWEISRKYSRFSSANNHLIGEAAGVYIASCYFRQLRRSTACRLESHAILVREMAAQVGADGGHRELAMGYHLFVLEFFLLAGLAARRCGDDFPAAYWERLEKMFEFVAAFAEGGGHLPMLNDCDDGYVLELGGPAERARGLLGVGAVLFDRSDFAALADGCGEPAFWLMGREPKEILRGRPQQDSLRSSALPEAGFYLLQCRFGDVPVSLTFDCGPLGFGSIAAHGHADALGLTLRVNGIDVLVDPGTYDYFTYRKWRDYFRSTRAHNTVVVDDQDQSEMLGLFLWGRKANSRCLEWRPTAWGGTATGEHDGYSRLPHSVIHRRTISLDGRFSAVNVRDELTGSSRHTAALHFHFGEDCAVNMESSNTFRVICDGKTIILRMDRQLTTSTFHGSEDPIFGWISRGYHRKTATTTLVGQCDWNGTQVLETTIHIL